MYISTFEEILDLPDDAIKEIMTIVDTVFMAKALTASSEALKEKILKNICEEVAKKMKEDMNQMGPASPIDEFVLYHQMSIKDIINDMHKAPLAEDAGPDEWA